MYKVLTINPGSTSTKLGYFVGDEAVFTKNVHHDTEELSKFAEVKDQLDFRKDEIIKFLDANDIKLEELDAIGARGGILPRHTTGTFLVTDEICEWELNSPLQHPVNLAAPIGKQLADQVGINAYITDGESSYELSDIARMSGHPEVNRDCYMHILNQKAIARFHCKEKGLEYFDSKLILIHMGGGISVGAHYKGKVVDGTDAVSEGPFTPERTGALPIRTFLDLANSGKYDYKQMKKFIQGGGGLNAYLGTNDAKKAVDMAEAGDENAKKALAAMALQIGKSAASMSVHFVDEQIDGILITGGMSNSDYITNMVIDRVKHIAPVFVYKGEREMESLAEGAIRILKGEEELIDFQI